MFPTIPYDHPEDENGDGLQSVGFFTVLPLDPAESPKKLHYTLA
jgi:hypothetical protein